MTRRPAQLALAGVLLLAGVLYLHRLGDAPINISTFEARFAVQAHAIASTGRDLHGNRMPLFFLIADPLIANHSSVAWWQPDLFYLMAGVFTFMPVSEGAARLPIACLAVLNIWLVAAVARRMFANPWYGVAAALLLTLTPAHFIMGRMATDYFLPLAFALAWLLCVLECQRSNSQWIAVTTGLVLGLGLYSYITSWLVMPLYLLMTYVVLWRAGKSLRFNAVLTLGFALPLLPVAAWVWSHPSMPRDVFTNYHVSTSLRIAERASLYWDYFNPSYLFFSGGSNLMWATRQAGVFPLAVAVLLPCGLWSIWTRQSSMVSRLCLAGFLLAPLPIVAALPEAPQYATARHLLAVPFGVLISIAGLEWLTNKGKRAGRILAALVLLTVPIQFTGFARDYFTDYRLRSSFWSDSMNMRGVVASVSALDAEAVAPAVFLNDQDLGEDKVVKWLFYLRATNRGDLWERTRYFSQDRTSAAAIVPGSLLVVGANSRLLNGLTAAGEWSVAAAVNDVAGTPAATILRRR